MSSVEVGALYVRLMEVLGYDQYYVQGGDWGGYVGRAVAGVAPPGRVLGLHVNFMPMFPNPVIGAVAMLAPSLVLGQDAAMVTPLRDYALLVVDSSGYLHEQATRPDTIGTVLAASPVSLAAWVRAQPLHRRTATVAAVCSCHDVCVACAIACACVWVTAA